MPVGRIKKLVHLTLQSSVSGDWSPASKGYGYLEADGESIYFESKVVGRYSFDDLQVGQEVEFQADPKLPLAKSVTPSNDTILEPPSPDLGGS